MAKRFLSWLPYGLLFVSLATGCRDAAEPADWVLLGGAVYTVDDERSWATALAIRGDRIAYVGDDDGARARIGPETEVLELEGRMVLPGFVDSHSHPLGAPVPSLAASLYGMSSLEEYLVAIGEYASAYPEREAIRGSGWSNTLFAESGPTRESLDGIVSDRPVVLSSEDGHSTWVNSLALERAGVSAETPDPEGGVIERDPVTGEPTGTLRESASALVAELLPARSIEDQRLALREFLRLAGRAGVTTVREAYVSPERSADAYDGTELTVRFRANLLFEPEQSVDELPAYLEERDAHQDPHFTVDAIKLFIDGVVEGETAYLLEPYAHRPDYRGELLWEPDHLNDVVAAFDAAGFIVHAHAIGDGAARVTLDAVEEARARNGVRDARHQMTHIQLVAPDDIRRFAELGVVAVPQPFWFTKGDYFEHLEEPFLGAERANGEYPMQSFFAAGAVVASASDFPVTIPFDPLEGIEFGVLRSAVPEDPAYELGPDERASLEDMIASFTIHGAYASFLESEIGSLEEGKLADVVVLSRNLFEIDPSEIGETDVLLTWFEGDVVYRAAALASTASRRRPPR